MAACQSKPTLSDSVLENELTVAGEERIVREFGMDINILLFLKWIIKDLL